MKKFALLAILLFPTLLLGQALTPPTPIVTSGATPTNAPEAGTIINTTSETFASGVTINMGMYGPSTGTWYVGAAVTLGDGDWDCYSLTEVFTNSITTYTGIQSAISTSLATGTTGNQIANAPGGQHFATQRTASSSPGSPTLLLPSPTEQYTYTTPTTMYGTVYLAYSGTASQVTNDTADIRCRRMR